MSRFDGAGQMTSRIQILALQKQGIAYSWQAIKAEWAATELSTKKSIFSEVGIGARSVIFTLRHQSLTMHQAFLRNGQHYFLTSIIPLNRLYDTVEAAEITPITAELYRNKAVVSSFPVCLTEKYLGHTQKEPYAETDDLLVAVTPKVIVLQPGDLLKINDQWYPVLICHTLDPFKNEYEIQLRKDVTA